MARNWGGAEGRRSNLCEKICTKIALFSPCEKEAGEKKKTPFEFYPAFVVFGGGLMWAETRCASRR